MHTYKFDLGKGKELNLRIKESFDYDLYMAAINGHQIKDPMPEPPAVFESVKKKDGTFENKRVGVNVNDSTYQNAVNAWQLRINKINLPLLYSMAVDTTDLDKDFITSAREYFDSEHKITFSKSDAVAAVKIGSLLEDKVRGITESESTEEDDMGTAEARFVSFLKNLDRVNMGLVDTFHQFLSDNGPKKKG